MRNALVTLVLMVSGVRSMAQTDPGIYDPSANADNDIAALVKIARIEHKHILLQAGGNWCSWCVEFNRFVHADGPIDSLLNKCFVVYHLNFSKENENRAIFARYGYPQRFGFPVFIVLDENGTRIHTQNSEYLEQGKSYNKQRVMEFLLNWTPQALDSNLYKWIYGR
ncbi:MAG TPA: thioredoxin family protein [Puia sp.]|nr:thioredoxin family protein [Puia sp.]